MAIARPGSHLSGIRFDKMSGAPMAKHFVGSYSQLSDPGFLSAPTNIFGCLASAHARSQIVSDLARTRLCSHLSGVGIGLGEPKMVFSCLFFCFLLK